MDHGGARRSTRISRRLGSLVVEPGVLSLLAAVRDRRFLPRERPVLAAARRHPFYNGVGTIALLWAATILNLVGLTKVKWLQNLGGIAWHAYGSATPITASSLVPDFTALPTLSAFAILILAYDGLELGPTMAEEIRNPGRVIPRAVFMAGVVIAVVCIAGTVTLLVALPPAQINASSGIPEALRAIGARADMPSSGVLTAALLTAGSIGALGGWITGSARLPFVVGLGHYRPERFAAIHPKYGTPHVALLAQAPATTVVVLAAISSSAIHEAYLLLIDMTVALVSIVWLFIFISLPVLRRRAAGRNDGVTLIPGGPVVCWLVAGVGAAATLFAGVVCLIRPPGSAHPGLFVLKGVGGCVVSPAAGVALYAQGSRRKAGAYARQNSRG